MSDDDADDFIAFGKALKPLEDDAIIRKKPIAVEEQIGRKILLDPFDFLILPYLPNFVLPVPHNFCIHSSRREWDPKIPWSLHGGLVCRSLQHSQHPPIGVGDVQFS